MEFGQVFEYFLWLPFIISRLLFWSWKTLGAKSSSLKGQTESPSDSYNCNMKNHWNFLPKGNSKLNLFFKIVIRSYKLLIVANQCIFESINYANCNVLKCRTIWLRCTWRARRRVASRQRAIDSKITAPKLQWWKLWWNFKIDRM